LTDTVFFRSVPLNENNAYWREKKMPRIARMIIKDEPAVYHIISRTALDGLVIGDVENEFLAALIRRLSSVYSTTAIFLMPL